MSNKTFLKLCIFFICSSIVISYLHRQSSIKIKKKAGRSHMIITNSPDPIFSLKKLPNNNQKIKRSLKIEMQKRQTNADQHLLFSEVTQNEALMDQLAKLPKPLLSRKLSLMGFLNNSWLKHLMMGMVGGTIMGTGAELLKKAIIDRKLNRIRKAGLSLGVKLLMAKKEAEEIRTIREKMGVSLSRMTNYQHLLENNMETKINSFKI